MNFMDSWNWYKILSVVGKLNLVIGTVSSVIACIVIAALADDMYIDNGALIALAILVGGVLVSVVTSAFIMTFAQMASDISSIAVDTFKMRKADENRNGRTN